VSIEPRATGRDAPHARTREEAARDVQRQAFLAALAEALTVTAAAERTRFSRPAVYRWSAPY
jgi:Homeodomain-like domain-containing protein